MECGQSQWEVDGEVEVESEKKKCELKLATLKWDVEVEEGSAS
jgi:hypothetical protein